MRGKGKSMENVYVSVEIGEYAKLIECKARMDIIKQYTEDTDYISYTELCRFLGIKDTRKEREAND